MIHIQILQLCKLLTFDPKFKSEVIRLHIMSLCRVASRGEIGEYFPPRFNPNPQKMKLFSFRVVRRVTFPVTEEYSNRFADPSSLR